MTLSKQIAEQIEKEYALMPLEPDDDMQLSGAHLDNRFNKYSARIRVNGEVKYLGYYDSEYDAAYIYLLASIKYHGEFRLSERNKK